MSMDRVLPEISLNFRVFLLTIIAEKWYFRCDRESSGTEILSVWYNDINIMTNINEE